MADAARRDEVSIRRAHPHEADEIATVYIASRRGAAAYLPTVGTDEEIRAFVIHQMVPNRETWVALAGSRIVGILVMLVAIGAALMGANASAQQPTAASTPAPRNPNWCSDVPAFPPPPHYQAANRPNAWAEIRKRCMNEATAATDETCMGACEGARELWERAKEGPPKEAPTYPLSTDKLQGPFPLQGGAQGWVLPVPPLATPAFRRRPTSMGDAARRDEVSIRRAQPHEADQIATVYIASRRGATANMPTVGTDDEIRAWVTSEMVPNRDTWVALMGGRIVGILVMEGDEVDQLYLLPAMQRRGIGERLLEHAKKLRPERLRLWTFQRNAPARRFYENRGFVAIEFSDGSRNMEREADVLYEWTLKM